MPLSWNEIKNRALAFSRPWAEETSERAEGESFRDGFFDVFGVSRHRLVVFEKPIHNGDGHIRYNEIMKRTVFCLGQVSVMALVSLTPTFLRGSGDVYFHPAWGVPDLPSILNDKVKSGGYYNIRGEWGQSLSTKVAESRGFRVLPGQVGDERQGIDLLQYRLDSRGNVVELRVVEMKTLNRMPRAPEEVLGSTKLGRQLSPRWIRSNLEDLVQRGTAEQRLIAQWAIENPKLVKSELQIFVEEGNFYQAYHVVVNGEEVSVNAVWSENAPRLLRKMSRLPGLDGEWARSSEQALKTASAARASRILPSDITPGTISGTTGSVEPVTPSASTTSPSGNSTPPAAVAADEGVGRVATPAVESTPEVSSIEGPADEPPVAARKVAGEPVIDPVKPPKPAASAEPTLAGEISEGEAASAAGDASTLSRIGKLAPVVIAAIVITTKATAIEERLLRGEITAEAAAKEHAANITGVIAGTGVSIICAEGGAELGAWAGGALGTLLPVVGTAGGAAIGFIAGGTVMGVACYVLGDKIGAKVGEWMAEKSQTVRASATSVGRAIAPAGTAIRQYFRRAIVVGTQVWEATKESGAEFVSWLACTAHVKACKPK